MSREYRDLDKEFDAELRRGIERMGDPDYGSVLRMQGRPRRVPSGRMRRAAVASAAAALLAAAFFLQRQAGNQPEAPGIPAGISFEIEADALEETGLLVRELMGTRDRIAEAVYCY